MPSPIPPRNPYPTTTSQYWFRYSPTPDTRKPPEKNTVATAIAQRGPFASTRVPNSAADSPSMMMPTVNGRALATPEMPSPFSSGVLNALHA